MAVELYRILQRLPRYGHEVRFATLPMNGIYFFFEHDELVDLEGREVPRIVRVGSHTGQGRFQKRIRQHYGRVRLLGGNRKATVFRKHVGGALIRRQKSDDTTLQLWLDKKGPALPGIEEAVSELMRDRFTFSCVRVDEKAVRLRLESGLIALLAQYPLSHVSSGWLGYYAASATIRESGLWNVDDVTGEPLNQDEFGVLQQLMTLDE